MDNVRVLRYDWHTGQPSYGSAGEYLARQYDHLSDMVVLAHAPKLNNYYLIVTMKETEDGDVKTLEPIQLSGSFWLIPNIYTQLAQEISFQFCCKTENGDFESHSAQIRGRILPSKDHNGEAIDVDPSVMFDPYKQWVSEIAMAAGAIVVDSELSSTSTNPVQNKVVKAAIDGLGDDISDINGRLDDTNAETTDIRVGADGTTYASAGAAVRGQIGRVNTELGIASSIDLDSVAYGNKTYRDIFETNNLIPYGDFENGLDWITKSTNNPEISDEAYVSKSHSLKCFGTSSTQIRKDITPVSDCEVACLCKVRVDRYVSGGGAGFVIGGNHLINEVTDGFQTLYYRMGISSSAASSVFIGTVSSANCDAYIDDFAIIDLTTLFGSVSNFPTEAKLTELYNNWIAIKNSGGTRLDTIEGDIATINEKLNTIVTKPLLVGAVLGASSAANRFAAMRQLYTVAQKILDDPTYQSSDSDLTYATNGAVCVLPPYSPSMYQKYAFDFLYSKNGTTQAIPASTTKVMTLVTGLDYINNLYERTTIVSDDIQDGSSSILSVGDTVTVIDLIYAMMLPSSNTAAMAFARIAGEKILISQNGEGTYTATECQNAFVSEMAIKATNLGMTNSVFVSPSGRSESNLTTVIDMLKFTIEACSYPIIDKIWNKKSYTIKVQGNNARNIDIVTSVTDAGLEADYYIFGGKTGTLSLTQSSIALVMVAQKK